MRSFPLLVVCGVLVLSACSSSGSESPSQAQEDTPVVTEIESEETAPLDTETDEEVSVTTAPPPTFLADEASELCPTSETISAATGLSITETGGVNLGVDDIASDPTSGATACLYQTEDSTFLTLTLHGSPINSQIFLESPLEGAEVVELASGTIQLQFEGQAGCEVYDDQVSVVIYTESDSTSFCEIAMAAVEATQ